MIATCKININQGDLYEMTDIVVEERDRTQLIGALTQAAISGGDFDVLLARGSGAESVEGLRVVAW